MVESDAPILIRVARPRLRVAAFVVLAAAVVMWDAVAPHIDPVGLWWTVAIIAAGVAAIAVMASCGVARCRY